MKADYTQIEGMASIGVNNSIFFASNDATPGVVQKFRTRGIAQMMSDGSFDFEPTPRKKSGSTRLKKVAHGSLSATKDGAVLLWLKVYKDEGVDIRKTLRKEANSATLVL